MKARALDWALWLFLLVAASVGLTVILWGLVAILVNTRIIVNLTVIQ